MKDYYEILGLNSEASQSEIKRAYFKMVRKYPPDRYEKQFMDIREAYETLSNEKTRKQYDSINFLSEDIKDDYNFATTFIEEGNLTGGIRLLEKILEKASELHIVKVLLAETYLKNSNSGKALKLYEELCKDEPENSAFAGYLGGAYIARGWNKKAIIAYEKALQLDGDNISLYIGLSEAYIMSDDYWKAKGILEKALQRVKDIGDSTTIYLKMIMLDIGFGMISSINKYLDKLAESAVNNEEQKDNVAWTLCHIATYLMNIERLEEAKNVIDKAVEILPKDKDIIGMKKEIDNFQKYIGEFEKLDRDKKIKKEVVALIAFEILPDSFLEVEGNEKEALGYFYEYQIIKNYEGYKASINRLEKNYAHLYTIKVDFFNKVKNVIDRKNLSKDYKKQYNNYKYVLDKIYNDDFDDEDEWCMDGEDEDEDDNGWFDFEEQEPYVREEAKIGRNDPCPCGSGKKYKKCCGK